MIGLEPEEDEKMSDWHHHHPNGTGEVLTFCHGSDEDGRCSVDYEEYSTACEGVFWASADMNETRRVECHFRLVWREDVVSEDTGRQGPLAYGQLGLVEGDE